MPDSQGYKNKLRIYNTHCFSTATIVPRTPLNVTLYVHCLSCLRKNLRIACYQFRLVHCFRKKNLKSTSLKTGFLEPRILTNFSIFCSFLLTLSFRVDVGTSHISEARSKRSSLFLNDVIALIVVLILCVLFLWTNV